MLKINNNFKKYKIPLVAVTTVIGGIFLFQCLTFVPEYSSAESISTPVYDGEPKPDNRTLSQITYMQEMTSGICERSAIGEENTNIIDSRDESGYSIKKLSDERCWMTQSLRIVNKAITSDDSNVTANYTIPASSSPWSNTDINTNKVHYAGNKNYGAYYTWYVATAGTSGSITSTNNKDYPVTASGSICPKGWRLPTGGDSGELQILYSKGSAKTGDFSTNSNSGWQLGGTTNNSGAAFFPASGYVGGIKLNNGTINGRLLNVGEYGCYWSSTAISVAGAYNLFFRSSSVTPSNTYGRYNGLSVRCINDPTIKDGTIEPDVLIPNPNVSVTVNPVLTLEVVDKEVEITPKTDDIATGEFAATVTSNGGYDIQLNATEDGSTALVNKKDGITIAEIQASDNVQVGTNGWGIKCIESADCAITNYSALTEYNNPKIYFTRQAGGINVSTKFQVGIGISSDLPSGIYSTNILVTASQK